MSTGNNQGDTLVSKKRKRVVRGYIHPIKPEVKKFDFFNGDPAYTGPYRISNSRVLSNIYNPVGKPSNGYGSFQLIQMAVPTAGSDSNERIGQKYNLKYIKFKGHIDVFYLLPFTIHYKLVLIKTDKSYSTFGDFCADNMNNYEPYSNVATNAYNNEYFVRHNFYKIYKNYDGLSDHKTSITTIASGTIAPLANTARPSYVTSLGTNPTISWWEPDYIRLGGTASRWLNVQNYLPINASITVNDCVDISGTYCYLCLLTDHGIGLQLPNEPSSGNPQTYYEGTDLFDQSLLKFNLFGICYYTDY